MRTFKPGGDMARLQRQNLVMKGLREKLVDPGTLLNISDLYKSSTRSSSPASASSS
jgi:anionic cell wall polymer biosynthesis LytR-Cps2A-Psr (LCP) family protein